MTGGRSELAVSYGSRFERRLRSLPEARRLSCLRIIAALAREEPERTLYLIDVVSQDDIERYGGS